MRGLINLFQSVIFMKVVCAWCGKHMSGNEDDEEVSHGMCDKCAEQYDL